MVQSPLCCLQTSPALLQLLLLHIAGPTTWAHWPLWQVSTVQASPSVVQAVPSCRGVGTAHWPFVGSQPTRWQSLAAAQAAGHEQT